MSSIRHVWFDFSNTIAEVNRAAHDAIKYATFAELTATEDSLVQREVFQQLYEKHGHSNAKVFAEEFGKGGTFWSDLLAAQPVRELYRLADPDSPEVLQQLSRLVPVSVFSNIETKHILAELGINTDIFTYILSSSQLQHHKPHPEGYQKMIELSRLPANEILYIGDIEAKDIIPANSVGLKTGMMWDHSTVADYNFADFKEVLELIKTEVANTK